MTASVIMYASIGGILPALFWLLFLLREDARAPEPKQMIALTFLAGMAAVLVALPLERVACEVLNGCAQPTPQNVILAWAIIEEVVKYGMVAAVVLWRKCVDEPIDLVIYMLTGALGFAALENALFLVTPLAAGDWMGGIMTGNLRFVGSTLLHVVASSAIGFTMGFSFGKPRAIRVLFASAGLILAVALHAIFNFLIISEDGSTTIAAFFTVWTGIIVFFALFEVLKSYEYRYVLQDNT